MEKLKSKTINLCKELYNLKKVELENKEALNEELENLREVMADILELKDKDGNPKPSRVKKALLKEAFLVLKEFKNNTLQEKLDTMEEYMAVLESNEEVKNYIQKLEKLNNNIENSKKEFKDIKKEVELTEEEYEELSNLGYIDKEWIKFVETVVKEKIKENSDKNDTSTEPVELFPIKEIKNKI